MAKLTDSVLKDLLPNAHVSSRNHYLSDCPLPSCGAQGHFYIQRDTQLWDCKKCKESGNIYQLLFKLGKSNLLKEGGRKVDFEKELIENKIVEYQKENSITDEDLKPVPIKNPIGYKRVFENDYLEGRGFTESDFNEYEVGKTRLKSSLREYIIIPVTENGINVGYLARSEKSKEEIKAINDKYKEDNITDSNGKIKKYLRWRNSTSADFSKLVYGIDEITPEVKTVILVEGVFAKRRIDRVFKLKKSKTVKCCATFGKNVGKYQIAKLNKKAPEIEQIVLFFDAEAVAEIKKFSFELQYFFPTVLIAVIEDSEDIDDVEKTRLVEIFDKLQGPFEFFNGRVNKKLKR